MTINKVILLNPTTVRIWIDFSGIEQHFDVPLSQITALDAETFASWAQTNLVPPVVPVLPAWLKALEGTTF